MTDPTFTQSQLQDLLVTSVGLSQDQRTDDPDATLTDIGLDSLAFLQLQTELQQRYGVVVDDSSEDPRLGDLVDAVNDHLRVSA